jgi:hypothetical protein
LVLESVGGDDPSFHERTDLALPIDEEKPYIKDVEINVLFGRAPYCG